MKKLFFVLAAGLVILSCGNQGIYPVILRNDSAIKVSYTYQEHTGALESGASVLYEVANEASGPVFSLLPEGQPRSVRAERKTDGWYFTNITPIPVSVENTLPFTLTITAADYNDFGSMDYLAQGTSPFVKIEAGQPMPTDVKIYTKNPRFSVSGGTAGVDWKIENDIMKITIR